MNLNTSTFSAVKAQIKNGDNAYFGGRGKIFSITWFIKLVSWLTHCEKFIWIPNYALKSGRMVEIEPTLCLAGMGKVRYSTKKGKMKTKTEFTIRPAERVIAEHKGKFYFAPLSDSIREIFNNEKFIEWCLRLVGTDYDFWGFIPAGIDDKHVNWLERKLKYIVNIPSWIFYYLKKLFSNSENYTKLICSEANGVLDIYSFGLEENASEKTPDDKARQYTHSITYYQFKGSIAEIPKFNTVKVKWSNK